ncbi:ARID DNA-binding domain-containing protein [Tanacetum coccineum]|uniref:ARID DNA-binding domain-containing protein n=1 Tax=Tanacetum coccineum TaxID=301880 RepID=A0ABQ5GEM3_9ASTR
MVNSNSFLEAKWRDRTKHRGHKQQWYQSEIHGRPPRKTSQVEFLQRQIKREKENRLGRCVRQITKDCKNMLKKKIEEIEVYNSSISKDKFKQYNCFYCNQKGHVAKACPIKIKDEASYMQGQTVGYEEGSRDQGHFANRCPTRKDMASTKEPVQPNVSITYPEFIHFKTRGILKGTDYGTWDDFWYVSNTTNKHLTSNINFFSNLKEEFVVEKMESQRKLLFTYGVGEVLIMNGNKDYLIPGVHYAPEVTLNILSINLLKQQGFEIVYEGNRCTLEYMFKNQHGKNIDVDKIRQRHNDYLDDYFESLDKERTDRKEEEPRIVEDTNTPVVQTFQEYVAFLNLIKDDNETSKEWDTYRDRFDRVLKWFYSHYLKRPLPGAIPPIIQGVPIHLFDLYKLMDCMGGYLSVQFGQEFGALAEILGLTRSEGEDIRKCYMTYLEVFVSYYKTARAPENPMTGEEDLESLEEYQWNLGKEGASYAVEKGKERLEHFGIELEEEEECKQQQPAYHLKEAQIKCYKCQGLGHYAFECQNKRKKDKDMFASYKEASTSKPTDNEDTQSSSSDDFIVIT